MKPIRFALVIAVLALSGCASLFGSHQKSFDFSSEPDGAEVFLDGASIGTTPVKVPLDNHKEYVFTFRKEGYRDVTCTLLKGTDAGWIVLDVLGGLVPVIVDAATGNWSQTKGDSCKVTLPITSTAVAGE